MSGAMTFLEWCRTQARRSDSNGDFARDWIADPDRPRAPSLHALEEYLWNHGAIDEAVEAGRHCYYEWLVAREAVPARHKRFMPAAKEQAQ